MKLLFIISLYFYGTIALTVWRADKRCGSSFLLSNNEPAQCDAMGKFPCCSAHGWCGISKKHCKCDTCTDYRISRLATTETSESIKPKCDKSKRDVHVILQLPIMSDHDDNFSKHIELMNIIKRFHVVSNRCFNMKKTTVIDSVPIEVEADGEWEQIIGNKPEMSLRNYLMSLPKEYNVGYRPGDPKRIVVLVVGDPPTDLPSLIDAAKGVHEYAQFIIVSVDLFDFSGNFREAFQKITRSENRYMEVGSFKELHSSITFERLLNLIENPSHIPLKMDSSLYSTQSVDEIIEEYSVANCSKQCDKDVDIAFIIDGSESVKDDYYYLEKKFVIGFAKALNFGESNSSRVGVIQFSKKAVHGIKLKDYSHLKTFAEAVMELKPRRLNTYIDKALTTARDEFFTEENGGRHGVKKLVVLITDGKQTKKNDQYTPPGEIAKQIRETVGYEELKSGVCKVKLSKRECRYIQRQYFSYLTFVEYGGPQISGCVIVDDYVFYQSSKSNEEKCGDDVRCLCKTGIDILAIGVGDTIDANEMSQIVGPEDRWRKAEDFEKLQKKEFVCAITKKACEIDKPIFCEQKVDLVFVLDASGSINKYTDYGKMKEFVITIANAFGISDTGAHAALVVFSDVLGETYYSDITIRLTDNNTISAFRGAVQNAKYYGHRTRIDVGFILAKEVFAAKDARREAKKVIILMTDGRQNPTGDDMDPVKESEDLYNKGVNIYAIGIGHTISKDQLEDITRIKHRVFFADNYETLASEEFVNNVSTTVCTNVNTPSTHEPTGAVTQPPPGPTGAVTEPPPGPTRAVTPPPPGPTVAVTQTPPGPTGALTEAPPEPRGALTEAPCTSSRPCTGCCGGCHVFNNIFNNSSIYLNLGPTYVVSGAQVSKDGENLSGNCATDRCKTFPITSMNIEKLKQMIKAAMMGMCNGKCNNNVQVNHSKGGFPTVVRKRKRRSINSDPKEEILSVMRTLSRSAGCNMFMQSLKKNGLMGRISKLMKSGHHVAVFCPIDTAYSKVVGTVMVSDRKDNERFLLNHIAIKHDKFATMYHTLADGRIIFNFVGKHHGASQWRANDVDVIISIQDGVNSEFVILNDVIQPTPNVGIIDALGKNPDVSIFCNLLKTVGYGNVLSSATTIKSICFTNDTCVSLTPSMIRHIEDAVEFNRFTLVAPTNDMFQNFYKDMPELNLDQLKEFIRGHIYLGTLGNPDFEKELAYSLSAQHNIMTTKRMKTTEGKIVTKLLDSHGNELLLKSALAVKEGTLLLVDTPQNAE